MYPSPLIARIILLSCYDISEKPTSHNRNKGPRGRNQILLNRACIILIRGCVPIQAPLSWIPTTKKNTVVTVGKLTLVALGLPTLEDTYT